MVIVRRAELGQAVCRLGGDCGLEILTMSPFGYIVVQKMEGRNMRERTWKPMVAGILAIVAGALQIILGKGEFE